MKTMQWSISLLAMLVILVVGGATWATNASQPFIANQTITTTVTTTLTSTMAITSPVTNTLVITRASGTQSVGDLNGFKMMKVERGMTEIGKGCVECHKDTSPGIVNDWRSSRHGNVGVSCIDCHQVEADAPTATQHETFKGTDVFISGLVSPGTCSRCHPQEAEQFTKSGHVRAYTQLVPKPEMQALMHKYEGQNHPELNDTSNQTGCMQCHGEEIKLGADKRPLPETWPNAGMGNVYPDGSVGNCVACHTRHRFSIAEARKPNSCASCHLGPDHPDIEIFESSKHGHLFLTSGNEWKWDSAPDAWEPVDYRGPTCATCHMSGIGKLNTTHDISDRLYWNLWAEESKPRGSNDPMSPLRGDAVPGREKMVTVCAACHSKLHTDGFFNQADKAVRLYNEAYYQPAKKMRDDLKAKKLLKDNPWNDEFQQTFYFLWHHEGRRARQGALMAGPDWAHWHGFFELQQDLYKLQDLYQKRISAGKIEE